jgi:drug/metabolite transporter (DMT)-like permease
VARRHPRSDRGAGVSPERERGGGLAAVITAAVVFSWGFVIVKALPLAPAAVAVWRLAIGAGVTAVAVVVMRIGWPTRRRWVIAAGVAFGLHQLVFIAATQRTSIAVVTLVGALQPLLVALVSRRTVGERVPRLLAASAAVAVLGVVVVVASDLGDPSRSLVGDLLAGVNLLLFTAYFLFAKQARADGAPTLSLTAGFLGVALVVVAPGLLLGGPIAPSAGQWGLIALLALVPGNGHLLVNWAHNRLSAALSSLVLAAVPLLAAVWAHLVFGEPYGWRQVTGMLLVIVAIAAGQQVERSSRLRALAEVPVS